MQTTPLVKVKKWVNSKINPKSFNVQTFRDVLVGNVISSTIGEVCAYRLLFQDVRGGELPSYVPDTLIVSMSALEALIVPFLSWFGFKRRRNFLVTYNLIVLLSLLSLYFLPSATIRQESEFCDEANSKNDISYQGMSARSIVRLTIIIMVTLTFQLPRLTSWTHGIAYCDEYAPERISVHFGALLLGRVVVLVIGNRLVYGLVENLLPVQISLLIIGYLRNLIRMLFSMPKNVPEVQGVQKTALPVDNRGFYLSVSRVVSNSLVLAVAMSASLLTAALWGVGYNRNDIIKVKFLMPASSPMSFDLLLRHLYIVMPIALAGVKFSAPLVEFCRKKNLKQAVITTIFALVFFILFTVLPRCDQGSVAGMTDGDYNYPECSLSCGCKPKWAEFNPVCVTDNMTTFLSPCHAGCSGAENINGLQVYTRCQCSGSTGIGGALPGACATDCKQQYILHDMLFIVATTFTLLALQAQGVLILKVVDPRDRSVAMGVLLAMVALMTFVGGHMMFVAIRVTTCQWYEGGECHLQNTLFPYVVGFCSSFLVLLSAAISIASIALTSLYEKSQSRISRFLTFLIICLTGISLLLWLLVKLPQPSCYPLVYRNVTESEVKKVSLTTNAVGSDEISLGMLIPILDQILEIITQIVKFSLTLNIFPKTWKEA